ncbi:MAG TPA: peptide chain release factor N(5)-glutamine methyltransferase [Candidatus Acidoferrales bacterium]|nr:peptide chain release factor N(5)-glutamine methyltransferase [Candidatus Acidoferrales bacterium]
MSQAPVQPLPGIVGVALRDGIRRLEVAGVPSAPLAAELLLLHTLGRDRAWIYAHPEETVSPEQMSSFFEFIAARVAGTPTQYLTGKQEFWGLEFEVTRDVLIPRPETEHVIEVALERLGETRCNAPLRVADIGTGSGCIAVALAKELPAARIYSTDISAAALAVARRNAELHGVADRILFVESNLLEAVSVPAQFDLIVSNPPYIGRSEAQTLPMDVRAHEPEVALFGGEDGLALYPSLIKQAGERLAPGGLLVLELGFGQFEPVSELLDASRGWTRVSAMQDLAGIVRVISAIKD